MSPDINSCRLCYRGPTALATLHQHRGRGLTSRHLVLRGPLCRECGLVSWRHMTLETALLGWWSPASLALTPVTLVLNSVALVKLLRTPTAKAVPVFPMGWVQPASRTA